MPLRPIDRLTGTPKAFEAFSQAEKEHWAQQVLDEQRINKSAGVRIDAAALDQAEAFAQGNQGLLDQIAAARLDLAKAPQPVTRPAAKV